MNKSIYDEMCKPSPLSRPPKPEPKLLTLDEFRALVQEQEDKQDPRNYRGANWSEVRRPAVNRSSPATPRKSWVSPVTSDPPEIQRAFRLKAKTAHPDAGGSAEEFRRITEARDVLLRAAGMH